jgi:hypothetical protein
VTADVLFLYRREIFMYETANFGGASNVYTYSLFEDTRGGRWKKLKMNINLNALNRLFWKL